jgi:hypothetical protein
MTEKNKCTPPSTMQVKNQRKTIRRKLDACSHEKGEQIADICHNFGFVHISMHITRGNADRITQSAKSVTKVFMWQYYHSPIGANHAKKYGREYLTFS